MTNRSEVPEAKRATDPQWWMVPIHEDLLTGAIPVRVDNVTKLGEQVIVKEGTVTDLEDTDGKWSQPVIVVKEQKGEEFNPDVHHPGYWIIQEIASGISSVAYLGSTGLRLHGRLGTFHPTCYRFIKKVMV